MRKNQGITLVALIITIIIMLILVAVSVNILIKSNLIGTAEKAANGYKTTYEGENQRNIEINGKKYDSIDDYVNKNNLQLKYKEGNGKVRIYFKNSLYNYIDELPMEEKNKFCTKYGNLTFEELVNNYIQEDCENDKQKFITQLQAINYDDAINIFYAMILFEATSGNDEAYKEFTEISNTFYSGKVVLTFNNSTKELSQGGNIYIITKNGDYKFTAKSEEGKTGELEIHTDFKEGKFKINIDGVEEKEYTFIEGLTWGELISEVKEENESKLRVAIMPDGLELWISADHIHGLDYNKTRYFFEFNEDEFIVNNAVYNAKKM